MSFLEELACNLQQVPQMLSAVTQAMPKLQRGRHLAFSWLGQDQEGWQSLQNVIMWEASCRVQRGGMLRGLLPAMSRSESQGVSVGPTAEDWRLCCCRTWVMFVFLPPPQYPAAAFGACVSRSQQFWESPWASGRGRRGCNVPAAPEQHCIAVCGQGSICVSYSLSWLVRRQSVTLLLNFFTYLHLSSVPPRWHLYGGTLGDKRPKDGAGQQVQSCPLCGLVCDSSTVCGLTLGRLGRINLVLSESQAAAWSA